MVVDIFEVSGMIEIIKFVIIVQLIGFVEEILNLVDGGKLVKVMFKFVEVENFLFVVFVEGEWLRYEIEVLVEEVGVCFGILF